MKKFIFGMLVGFLLAVPAFAFAEQTSMIGKRVEAEFPVIVDGEQLEVNAVVIEGSSYLPVRATGEVTERKVEFRDKTVILTKLETVQQVEEAGGRVETQTPQTPPTTIQEQQEPTYTLESIERAISSKEGAINALKMAIGMAESAGDSPEKIEKLKEELAKEQQELERLRQIKAELEAQQ